MESDSQNVEEVLEATGGFGRFQILALVLLLSMEIPAAMVAFTPVIIGRPHHTWRCGNETVPFHNICRCEGDLSAINPSYSVVAEWELACHVSWVSDAITSAQLVGSTIGGVFMSQVSDWYGRRHCYFAMTFLMFIATALTAAAPSPYVYLAARFIAGFGFSGLASVTVTYTVEFFTPKWRPLCGAASPFGLGIVLLGVIAYYIQPWRTFTWITLVPYALAVLTFFLIPESPRWLLGKGKTEECHKALEYIARVNKKPAVSLKTIEQLAENNVSLPGTSTRPTYMEFWRDKSLLKTTLCMQAIWITWGLVYFGISFNLRNLQGDPHLNMVYLGVIDTIGYPFSLLIANRFGRRRSLFATMTFTATILSIIAIVLLASEKMHHAAYVVTALSFAAKFGTAIARPLARTLTGESFPTALRTMGVGIVTSPSYIAGGLAPLLAHLGTSWPSLPYFVFAVISIGGSLVGFKLRETAGKPLDDYVTSQAVKRLTTQKSVESAS